eukprot:4684887-Pyramimonas_sp.AAC.1
MRWHPDKVSDQNRPRSEVTQCESRAGGGGGGEESVPAAHHALAPAQVERAGAAEARREFRQLTMRWHPHKVSDQTDLEVTQCESRAGGGVGGEERSLPGGGIRLPTAEPCGSYTRTAAAALHVMIQITSFKLQSNARGRWWATSVRLINK